MSGAEKPGAGPKRGLCLSGSFRSLKHGHRVGGIVTEPSRILGKGSRRERLVQQAELLRHVGLPSDAADSYPQRIQRQPEAAHRHCPYPFGEPFGDPGPRTFFVNPGATSMNLRRIRASRCTQLLTKNVAALNYELPS